jgi:hypothetical protein
MLKSVVAEIYRILKPNRWVSVCYHDTSEGSWVYLQDIFAEVGFFSEQIENVLSIERDRKSWKQATTSQVPTRDLVINFRKPNPGELFGQLNLFDDSDFNTFAEAARAVLTDSLTTHPGSPADRIYDQLVSRLVRKGQFERHNFDETIAFSCRRSTSRFWTLVPARYCRSGG